MRTHGRLTSWMKKDIMPNIWWIKGLAEQEHGSQRSITRSSPAEFPPGDQDLNRKSCLVIPMCEVLERKDREQGIPYESDADKTDEEIVVGLMEITALSLKDVLDDEPSYE